MQLEKLASYQRIASARYGNNGANSDKKVNINDPYRNRYVPPENQTLVNRANALIKQQLETSQTKQTIEQSNINLLLSQKQRRAYSAVTRAGIKKAYYNSSVNNNEFNINFADNEVMTGATMTKFPQSKLEQKFDKFMRESKISGAKAVQMFAQREATGRKILQDIKQERKRAQSIQTSRESAWKKKLDDSPYLVDQLLYVQHNEQIQKMKIRQLRQKQYREKKQQELDERMIKQQTMQSYDQILKKSRLKNDYKQTKQPEFYQFSWSQNIEQKQPYNQQLPSLYDSDFKYNQVGVY